MMTEILETELREKAPVKITGGWHLPFMVIYSHPDTGEWWVQSRSCSAAAAIGHAADLPTCKNVKIIKLPDIPPEPLEKP